MKHFILRTDHKPLEWLATVSDAHGRRGRWVGMLQDFSFKIVHRPGLRHTNADALSRNPVGSVVDDEDFGEEIQDIASAQAEAPKKGGELLCALTGEETEWMGVKRKDRRLTEHSACCFGINHRKCVSDHQLFMLDVASKDDLSKESIPGEEAMPMGDAPVQHEEARVVLKRRRPQYFDKQQQLDLVLATQELSEFGDHELSSTGLDDEEDHGVKSNCVDIWEDTECLTLLKEGVLLDPMDLEESNRIRKRASNYCWKEQKLFFKALLVPKPEERVSLCMKTWGISGNNGRWQRFNEGIFGIVELQMLRQWSKGANSANW